MFRTLLIAFLGAAAMVAPSRATVAPGTGDRPVPQYALEVYRAVLEHGEAPEGYVGGRAFQNRERLLPAGGNYREYDVHPKVRGKNRGPERIVVDLASRKGWYTPDHYRSFYPIKQAEKHGR